MVKPKTILGLIGLLGADQVSPKRRTPAMIQREHPDISPGLKMSVRGEGREIDIHDAMLLH